MISPEPNHNQRQHNRRRSISLFRRRRARQALEGGGIAGRIETFRPLAHSGAVVKAAVAETLGNVPIAKSQLCYPLLLQHPPDPAQTFESLVPFKANELAREVAWAIATGERPIPYSVLYVHGGEGLGKTHLLSAVKNLSGHRRALLINTAELDAELERATARRACGQLRDHLTSYDVLLLDDVHLCAHRPRLQRKITAVLSDLRGSGRPVIVASEVPPAQLCNVSAHLIAQLCRGVVASLGLPEEAERLQVLQQIPGSELFVGEVAAYLAAQITGNVRQLRAAAEALLSTHRHTGCLVTMHLARSVVPRPEDRQPGPAAAQEAEQFKSMLASAETEKEQALALQIAIDSRLRDLRRSRGNAVATSRLERALSLLRDGRLSEAIAGMLAS